jgi:DNA polymerase-4
VDLAVLESTLAHLSEMVGRRLREHALHARTVQLKLRYKDFSTITRSCTLACTTQLDTELYREIRTLFEKNWNHKAVRLLGVQAASLERLPGQLSLLEPELGERWRKALSAADQMRDRYGESAVSLAAGLKGSFRERVHENPASLPGKHPK